MRPNKIKFNPIFVLAIFFCFSNFTLYSQIRFADRVRVINMIPNGQSGETWQDSEPNIAVDPSDPSRIVASAFTRNPNLGNTTIAPIYISNDGGNTWQLNNIVPTGPTNFSTSAMTGDISLTRQNQWMKKPYSRLSLIPILKCSST